MKHVRYAARRGVATITLNRPEKLNAFTLEMLGEIGRLARRASFDDAVRVVVLTGAGDRAFCTGADVREYREVYCRNPRGYWKYMQVMRSALEALLRMGKPTIARVNGMAVGGGNELQMACDLAVAAEHAEFGQVGASVGSVACLGATQWLPLLVGERRARWMLMFNERISAETALEWGLINDVVPAAKLDERVAEWAARLQEKFAECMRYTREQLNFWKELAWNATVGHGAEWLTMHFYADEVKEGTRAFIEKRRPDYRVRPARALRDR